MQYFDAKRALPTSAYLYAKVTTEELEALVGSFYTTTVEGVTILGTDLPVEDLADKELVPGKMYLD